MMIILVMSMILTMIETEAGGTEIVGTGGGRKVRGKTGMIMIVRMTGRTGGDPDTGETTTRRTMIGIMTEEKGEVVTDQVDGTRMTETQETEGADGTGTGGEEEREQRGGKVDGTEMIGTAGIRTPETITDIRMTDMKL